MKKQDLVGGFFWLALGIFLCIGSAQLGIGKLRTPGAGFLPFLSGSLLVIFGLILTLTSLGGRARAPGERDHRKAGLRARWNYFRLPFITLAALLAYILVLGYLGFAITTFLWLFLLFKLGDPERWSSPLLFSLGIVVVSHFVFVVWLQLQLPKGPFGF